MVLFLYRAHIESNTSNAVSVLISRKSLISAVLVARACKTVVRLHLQSQGRGMMGG